MTLFKRFLHSNRQFWSKAHNGFGGRDLALIDASVNDTYLLHGIVKVGLIFATLHKLRPLAFISLRTLGRDRAMVKSMCSETVPLVWCYVMQLVKHGVSILRMTASVRRLGDLLKIEVSGIRIGDYIYDQCYVPMVDTITFRMRLRILYALASFYVDRAVIRRGNIRLVIIGDPVTRGFLFELCKAHGIRCVSGINIHMFQMHKYFHREEFDNHCRYITHEMLDKVPDSDLFTEMVEEYFERRFNGRINTHDVARAYGADKTVYSKEQLCAEYDIQPKKPLVVVMAHCFNDTPHAYPGLLYRDYEDWLIAAVTSLAKNQEVNFLIKEHPSADLYQERGMVVKMMASLGFEGHVLKSHVHNRTVIDAADVAVTCGGTIGLEMSSYGKPVVLAARPPYANKGFTIEPETREAHEFLLTTRIQRLSRLTEEQKTAARKTAFLMLELYDNFSKSLELGGIQFMKGRPYSLDDFFQTVILENRTPLEDQQIYRKLDDFNRSDDVSIINYQKLRGLESTTKRTSSGQPRRLVPES